MAIAYQDSLVNQIAFNISVPTSKKTQLFLYYRNRYGKGNNSCLYEECTKNDKHSVCKVKVGIVNVE